MSGYPHPTHTENAINPQAFNEITGWCERVSGVSVGKESDISTKETGELPMIEALDGKLAENQKIRLIEGGYKS